MKRIDKLLLQSFFGPFAVSFGVGLLVLIMQFLWLYIDEIAGKGVSVLTMLELLAYLSVSVFPMALPIAVLISSVMVLGTMAERYELSSLKSAGVPLLRTMRPLILASLGIAVFSWICSNWIIPASNLQFKSRLYDIRKAKPALSLEPGVFNEDFRNFTIRIGQKARDGETIQQILLNDASRQGSNEFSQILADSGRMWTTSDKRFFVMNLFRGEQYQQPTANGRRKYPFIRTSFKEYRKVWDMKEFDLSATDPNAFKEHRTMLSMTQLKERVDSLQLQIHSTSEAFIDDVLKKSAVVRSESAAVPSSGASAPTAPVHKLGQPENIGRPALDTKTRPKPTEKQALKINPRPDVLLGQQDLSVPRDSLEKPLVDFESWVETLDTSRQALVASGAASLASSHLAALVTRNRQIDRYREESVKTAYELYSKYSFAAVCAVFLFIGAPLGAIIRKGGFGYPILVAIIFFMLFISLSIACRKLAETYVMMPFWAAMMPCFVLLPLGFWLTFKAMNDAPMAQFERLQRLAAWVGSKFKRSQAAA